jgi:hypothetical protein
MLIVELPEHWREVSARNDSTVERHKGMRVEYVARYEQLPASLPAAFFVDDACPSPMLGYRLSRR